MRGSLLHNKRGSDENVEARTVGNQVPETIFLILMAVFAVLGLGVFFSSVLNGQVTFPPDVRTTLAVERFISSDNCLLYQQGMRAFPGIMDWERFKDSSALARCYEPGAHSVSFRISLVMGKETKTVKSRNWADDLKVSKTFTEPILIYDSGTLRRGIMEIDVQEAVQ